MQEEKKFEDLSWVIHGGLKFRIRQTNAENSIIWVSMTGNDLGFSLVMNDFLEYCTEELGLEIEIDSSWHNWKGFLVKNREVNLVIGEIINYQQEMEIEPAGNNNGLTEAEWYSV